MPPRSPPLSVGNVNLPTTLAHALYAQQQPRNEVTPQGWQPGTRDPNVGQSAGPPGYGAEPVLMHQPGGELLFKLAPSVPAPEEVLFRSQAQGSWFAPSVAPTNPVSFEIGSFAVPTSMQFWLFDYEFLCFRQSGLDPLDAVAAEDGRFNTTLGFDLTVNGRRSGHLFFQLDPVPPGTAASAFSPVPFAGVPGGLQAAYQAYAPNSAAGTSLLPARRVRYGAPGLPFTIIAKEGDRVTMSCTIFRQVNAPLKFVQARVLGYLLGSNAAESLLQRMRPR
jgi:hypothetical protein